MLDAIGDFGEGFSELPEVEDSVLLAERRLTVTRGFPEPFRGQPRLAARTYATKCSTYNDNTPVPNLPTMLRVVYGLLRRTAPSADDYDVAWHGPYFIPRSGQWHPTHFLLYGGHVYATVTMGWEAHRLTWRVGTDEVHLESEGGWAIRDGDHLWRRVLEQVVRRLREAVKHPERYNRRVQRLLPLQCRTGKVERRLTWPRSARPPIPEARLRRVERLLEEADVRPGFSDMTLSRFLKTAAVALDAAFRDLKSLSRIEKYRRRADTRHGGLLSLPAEDAQAFARWYRSRAWSGAHPWEIVFGHPHGILLAPIEEGGAWRFSLSVDSLGLYVEAATMAVALLDHGAPLRFPDAAKVLAALKGSDLVEVGPFFRQLGLEELERVRPGARRLVHWDRIPPIAMAADEDRRRIAQVEATGRPRSSR